MALPSQAPYPPNDHPRSLRDPAARDYRRSLLGLPHVAPLAAYAASLRTRPGVPVADFDPLDGGVDAQILFLLEKPGPMTAQTPSACRAACRGRAGSGFISRDNDSSTAEAIYRFTLQAGLPRTDTVIWNVIPWWNGTIRLTTMELTAGLRELRNLLALLPRLHTAVLVGRTAAQARPILHGLRLLESAHPSPQVRAGYRAKWDSIPDIWRQARGPAQI